MDAAVARTPVVAPAPPSPPPDPIASRVAQVYAPGESLPEPLRKRLRAVLKDRSRSPIALHHVIDLPRPDGSHEVFALYEYAVYEDCVARYPDRETGREHCAGHFERVFDHVDTINDKEVVRYRKAPINRDCLALGAVHAVLGPPGTRPADALVELTATDLPDLRCHPVAYQRVAAADVDGDHQLELYIDVTTMDDWVGSFRDSFGTVSALRSDWDRRLFILAGTDVRNAELAVRVDQVRGHGDLVPEELVELRDVDGDGHLDVIVTEMRYMHSASDGIGEPLELEGRNRTVYRYDPGPGMDVYREGIPLHQLDGVLETERQAREAAAANPAPEAAVTAPTGAVEPATAPTGEAGSASLQAAKAPPAGATDERPAAPSSGSAAARAAPPIPAVAADGSAGSPTAGSAAARAAPSSPAPPAGGGTPAPGAGSAAAPATPTSPAATAGGPADAPDAPRRSESSPTPGPGAPPAAGSAARP